MPTYDMPTKEMLDAAEAAWDRLPAVATREKLACVFLAMRKAAPQKASAAPGPLDPEIVEDMRRAAAEIRELRTENRRLAGIALAVEAFHTALMARPPQQGIAPDMAWTLERRAEALARSARE